MHGGAGRRVISAVAAAQIGDLARIERQEHLPRVLAPTPQGHIGEADLIEDVFAGSIFNGHLHFQARSCENEIHLGFKSLRLPAKRRRSLAGVHFQAAFQALIQCIQRPLFRVAGREQGKRPERFAFAKQFLIPLQVKQTAPIHLSHRGLVKAHQQNIGLQKTKLRMGGGEGREQVRLPSLEQSGDRLEGRDQLRFGLGVFAGTIHRSQQSFAA